jgi:hypothetical protein
MATCTRDVYNRCIGPAADSSCTLTDDVLKKCAMLVEQHVQVLVDELNKWKSVAQPRKIWLSSQMLCLPRDWFRDGNGTAVNFRDEMGLQTFVQTNKVWPSIPKPYRLYFRVEGSDCDDPACFIRLRVAFYDDSNDGDGKARSDVPCGSQETGCLYCDPDVNGTDSVCVGRDTVKRLCEASVASGRALKYDDDKGVCVCTSEYDDRYCIKRKSAAEPLSQSSNSNANRTQVTIFVVVAALVICLGFGIVFGRKSTQKLLGRLHTYRSYK